MSNGGHVVRWVLIALTLFLLLTAATFTAYRVVFPQAHSCSDMAVEHLDELRTEVASLGGLVGGAHISQDCLDSGHAGVDAYSLRTAQATVAEADRFWDCLRDGRSGTTRTVHCTSGDLGFQLEIRTAPNTPMGDGRTYNTEISAELVSDD